MEVASYRQAAHETAPDFDKPLDTQPCEIDTSVASWQQYFLKRALNSWHSALALSLQKRGRGHPHRGSLPAQHEKPRDLHVRQGLPRPISTATIRITDSTLSTNGIWRTFPRRWRLWRKSTALPTFPHWRKDIAGASAEDLTACMGCTTGAICTIPP